MFLYTVSIFSLAFTLYISIGVKRNSKGFYHGLSQGSCLSPILFNIYSSFISYKYIENGFSSLFYADDIVIYPFSFRLIFKYTGKN